MPPENAPGPQAKRPPVLYLITPGKKGNWSVSEHRPEARKHSNAYNIFILVLTIMSLTIMVALLLPFSPQTLQLLGFYDNAVCIIFLLDFSFNLIKAPKKSDYFIRQKGWLDLLGSIPSFGVLQYGGLVRLARLGRVARITRLLREQDKKELFEDLVNNRSQYVGIVTLLLTFLVLTTASVLEVEFESRGTDPKITTGWQAFWYSMVTITTVGYGDYYPVTVGGQITAMFIMVAGVGIIAVLASLLSNLLIGQPAESEEEPPPVEPVVAVDQELAVIKEKLTGIEGELAALRQLLANEVQRTP